MSNAAFFAAVKPLFGGVLSQSQVDGLNALLDATTGLPISHRAYLLATAQHETAHTMQPVRETLASTDDEAIVRLDRAFAKGQLKWVSKPYWCKDSDGKAWLGRGYVQLTHKANYEKASALTGVDLVATPNAAMRPAVAAKILVSGSQQGVFTGKKLSDYLPGDYVNARRIINGTDKAEEIARLARTYETALLKVPVTQPTATTSPANGIIAALAALLKAMFGGNA